MISFIQKQHKELIISITKIVAGSLIMAISAQITIPLPFVSITAQTLALFLIMFTLGAKSGLASIILYVWEGALGFPVFSNAGFGLPTLLGPSGGYIFGYIGAALVISFFQKSTVLNHWISRLGVLLLATSIIYFFGLLQLSLYISSDQIFSVGLIPFIAGDILKVITATSLAPLFIQSK